ncbi:hypothetical protein [Mycolicibacterium hippocampi]|uniref:Pyridine nucleotide-disulfide oxidoreductase n=1 Tax=Mycolicibacterium hippocampi TaxID=659824 RepID=A0A7I9ZIN9_9MYCO|nr:hypothetical protein [Mycolicibacterium hippocampi]GFH00547.1 hypothetical protein MHIP_10300 [Mycolicibacterium hippocampi]
MTISTDDVRRLLDADDDSVLVLIEGRVEVITGGEIDDEKHRGALEVISRAALLERTGGTDLSDHELTEQAAALDTEVSELGA